MFCKDKDPLLYVFFQLVILTVVAAGYSFIFEANVFKEFAFSFDILNILQVIFLGVVCTALCWVMRTISIKNVSAVTCAVLMPMAAVVATLTSIIFKMEQFSWNVVIGGLVITLAIVISGVWDA